MKKLIYLLAALTVFFGVVIAVPVSAEVKYKKDSVIKAEVIMPETTEIAGMEGKLKYNSKTLQYNAESFQAPHMSDIVYNANKSGVISFNSSQPGEKYNISSDHIVVFAQFTVIADITADDITSVIEDAYTLDGVEFVDVSTYSQVRITIISQPVEETEASEATQDSQETQAPEPSITLTADKTRIYVGEYTTVAAVVSPPAGGTVFTSSNTKVAAVSSGGRVTGLKEGTVIITAKNNGASKIITIKIIRRANTVTAKAKAKVFRAKYNRKTVFKKARVFKITCSKGKVSFKKYKGSKNISVSSSGNITVKKEAKRGAYIVSVKVTAKGDTKYKAKTVIVKLKIKVVK